MPQLHYDPPKRAVGKRLARVCAIELKLLRERKANSERLLTSLICLLTRDRNTKGAPAIKRKLAARINDWEAEKYGALFEDTLRSVKANKRQKQGNEDTNHRARIFHRLVMRGKVRTAARYMLEKAIS